MQIQQIANSIADQCNSRDPFIIAERLGILYVPTYLNTLMGYYVKFYGQKCISINTEITDERLRRTVMAHELGHAILHEAHDFVFYSGTLLKRSKPERQANQFAAELLIPDTILIENPEMTIEQLSKIAVCDIGLFEFKNSLCVNKHLI